MAATASNFSPDVLAEGLPVGKWLFYPSVEAVWQNEDNLFLSNVDPVGATSYALRPRLQWVLPFRDSHFKVAYSPQMRTFLEREVSGTSGLEKRYYSHFGELDTKLGFSSGLDVNLHDEYVIDALETIHFDPGQSVPFGNNNQYRRNHAELEAVKQIGDRHGAGVRVMHEFLNFDGGDTPLFLNYTRAGGALVYVFRLTPLSQLKASYGFSAVDQDHPSLGSQHFDTDEVQVKLEGSLGRNGLTESTLGYTRWDFSDSNQKDFTGITGEFRYRLLLNERMRLSTSIAKYPLQSVFGTNDYYLTRNIDVRLDRDPSPHLYFLAALGYRLNDFPERVVLISPAFDGRRQDRVWRGEAGMGYKFLETLRAEVRYRRENRSSNLDFVDYDSSRIVVQLSFGWY